MFRAYTDRLGSVFRGPPARFLEATVPNIPLSSATSDQSFGIAQVESYADGWLSVHWNSMFR